MFKGLKNLFSQEDKNKTTLKSPFHGQLIPLSEVNDITFSDEMVGKGAAVIPSEGYAVAPIDGNIVNAFKTGHAFTMVAEGGQEILVHIGLDTVNLKGEHFEVLVEDGQPIKQGEKVIKFDLEKLKELGYDVTSPVVICNSMDYTDVKGLGKKEVNFGDDIIEVVK